MSKYLLLKNDVVFKNVFYRDEQLLKDWLIDLMSLIKNYYHWDKKTIKVLNTELTKDRIYIKNKTIDIKLDLGEYFLNLEMNNNHFYNYEKNRNTMYLMSMSLETVNKQNGYKTIKPVVQINFTFQGKKVNGIEYKSILDEEDYNKYVDWIKIININVDYFIDEWYNSNNKQKYFNKYKSIIVLGLSKQELKEMEAIGYMKKIQMEVDELNRSPEFHQLFTDEEDQEMIKNSIRLESLEQGIEQGLEQGLKQGRAENLIDKMTIAKNLIHFGMNPNDVSKNTGLSKEIVNNLIHN